MKILSRNLLLTFGGALYGCNQPTVSPTIPAYNGPKIVASKSLLSQAIDLRFSPDGKSLMIAGSIGKGSLGRYEGGDSLFTFESTDKRLRVWNVIRQREVQRLVAKPIFGDWNGDHMLLMPDFKTLVTSWGAWEIKLIDVHKRYPDKIIDMNNGYISGMDISPDGKILVVGMTREVQFLDAKTYRLLRKYEHGGQGTQVNFGLKPNIVRCTWAGMKPHFVDINTGKYIPPPRATKDFEVTWSSDKKWFAQLVGQNTIEVWKQDGSRSIKVRTFASKLVEIRKMQFSPDGKLLVAGGYSSTVTPIEFFNIPQLSK